MGVGGFGVGPGGEKGGDTFAVVFLHGDVEWRRAGFRGLRGEAGGEQESGDGGAEEHGARVRPA